jgi:2'-5' RNA ligase
MKTIRCFLAVKLDFDTVRSISEVQLELKNHFQEAGARVKWVPPPNMHITIRFLGQVTEPMTYALQGMLEPIISETSAFELETADLGVFPNDHKPRIVWAGTRAGATELEKMHTSVSERLQEAGFHLDEKPFKSHITLGRIKQGNAEPLTSYLDREESQPFFGTTLIRNLYCYRSDLSTQGAEYHTMWRLKLPKLIQEDTYNENPNSESNQRPKGGNLHDDNTR